MSQTVKTVSKFKFEVVLTIFPKLLTVFGSDKSRF